MKGDRTLNLLAGLGYLCLSIYPAPQAARIWFTGVIAGVSGWSLLLLVMGLACVQAAFALRSPGLVFELGNGAGLFFAILALGGYLAAGGGW